MKQELRGKLGLTQDVVNVAIAGASFWAIRAMVSEIFPLIERDLTHLDFWVSSDYLPNFFGSSVSFTTGMQTCAGTFAFFALCAFVINRIHGLPAKPRAAGRPMLIALPILNLVLTGWIFLCTFDGSGRAITGYRFRTQALENALEERVILESLEGRKPNIPPDLLPLAEAAWDDQDRSNRSRALYSTLAKVGDPAAQKRILATLIFFRHNYFPSIRNQERAKSISEAVSGESFGTLEEFWDWLDPQIGTDGWIPLDVYRMRRQ